jgi:hypothetical protein
MIPNAETGRQHTCAADERCQGQHSDEPILIYEP